MWIAVPCFGGFDTLGKEWPMCIVQHFHLGLNSFFLAIYNQEVWRIWHSTPCLVPFLRMKFWLKNEKIFKSSATDRHLKYRRSKKMPCLKMINLYFRIWLFVLLWKTQGSTGLHIFTIMHDLSHCLLPHTKLWPSTSY